MRLPVGKILWGMFAFPLMYPAAFFAAAGLPLLGLIAVTLAWASGAMSFEDQVSRWGLAIVNYMLFAWLAVRTHRLLLIGPDANLTQGSRVFPLSLRYLAALATGAALKFLFLLAVMAAFSLLSLLVSFFIPGTPYDPAAAPASPPQADPDIQRLINYGVYVVELPVIYLLARWSTLLPAIALGYDWAPKAARRQTLGNGWRLVIVVFLLPWALDAAVDWAYAATESPWIVGILAVIRAVFLALGVIALSLSYRELPPWPEPPPTTPPA